MNGQCFRCEKNTIYRRKFVKFLCNDCYMNNIDYIDYCGKDHNNMKYLETLELENRNLKIKIEKLTEMINNSTKDFFSKEIFPKKLYP